MRCSGKHCAVRAKKLCNPKIYHVKIQVNNSKTSKLRYDNLK